MESIIRPLAFHSALLRGANRVEEKREELNRINGFPVPDRDTGNNLAYLMQHLKRQLPVPKSYEELLAKLSEASLLGARGNSGAIFSQYFYGFREAAEKMQESLREHLPLQGLSAMFHQGYASALRSIQQPREGTILSAMRSFSDAFHQILSQGQDLKRTAEASLLRLRETVRESMNILPQQRALHAPDAGAMAFLYFTEGFMDSLLGQAGADDKADEELYSRMQGTDVTSHAVIDEVSPNRFCTEVLIKLRKDAIVDEAVKSRLAEFGDSLVVSQSGGLLRVHLHTNTPAQAADMLEGLGEISEVKADDMHMQQALSRPHPDKTALVIDSIADIPEELLGQDVYCLPLHLLADGVSYQDKRSISLERMRRLAGKISSSQLNLAEISQFLDPIVKNYAHVLILTVSSKMSGLYERYQEYLAHHPEAKIRLVDSRVNSGAEGLLALHAIERLQKGWGLDQVADELERTRFRAKIFVSLPNLKAMISSGRLNRRVGGILQKIGFLPLITINLEGEGTVTGLSFSRRRSDRLLLNKLVSGKVKEYAVVHANNPLRAAEIAKIIQQRIGMAPRYICEISSIVMNFAGESAFAVAYIENDVEKGVTV